MPKRSPVLKRLLAVLTTATLAIGLALGAALPAAAHNANYSATCGSLNIDLVAYGSGNNYVWITIDGAAAETKTKFSYNFTRSYSWSPTTSHTFKIEIDAADAGYDKLGANAITGTFGPCTTVAACLNPLKSTLNNFTIVTEGDVRAARSGAHVEGTIAAGNDLIVDVLYHTQNNKDGSALPNINGQSVGLLTGGKVTLNASDEAFRVMAGATRVGSVPSGASTTGSRFYPTSNTGKWLMMSADASLDDVKASGLFASTFSGAFTSLKADADKIAGYTKSDVQLLTHSANGGDGRKVTLVAGVTNVLRVSGSELGSITKLWFDGGVLPSATTPFIIDVTDSGSFNSTVPVLMNIDPRYVLWNYAKATTLGLYTNGGGNFLMGSVLAPRAAVTLNSGGIEGQVAVASLHIKSEAEIHHFAYSTCATQQSVSGAATTAPAICDTTTYTIGNGSVTATVKTGVRYELWNQAKTTKIADLTAGTPYSIAAGSYVVRVIALNSSYTVSGANEWIPAVVGAFTGTCEAPQDVSGAATSKAQTCDVSYDLQPGSITATVKTGVVYELWNQAKDTKIADLTAGTARSTANGTYFVKVLPASSAYTVSTANTWIEVVVGPYIGLCAESVSGAATATAEICDTADYEVKNGSVTATVKTGVVYELWNQAKTNKIVDLTAGTPYSIAHGTYFVRVIAATAKHTVSSANEWIEVVVGEYTGLCAQQVVGAASAADEICDANYDIKLGAVTATVKTGVVYELWNQAKTVKIADLTAGTPFAIGHGSYVVKVLPATSKFYVAGVDEWIPVAVGEYTGLCAQVTSGSATPSAETCDTTDWSIQLGSIVANAAPGVTYELWNQAKTTKIANLVIGTPYPVAHGDYAVKVLPLTSKFHVDSANEWIPLSVGEFTGICAQAVSGSATPSAETCDTADYSIAKGSITPTVAPGVRYELWTADKGTKIDDLTAGAPYAVDGGTYYVRVIALTSKFHVASGDEWLEQIVGDFTGTCAEDVKGSAMPASETCDATNYVVGKGTITPGKADGVIYELWNQAKDTKIADLTAEQAYQVDGGTYFVRVLPATAKYTVSTANEWIEVVVPTNKKVCAVIGDPVKFEGCVVNPNDLDDSDWTASLTIVAVDHVQYRVYISDGITWVDQGLWAAGKHDAGTPQLPFGALVKVVAEADAGWTLLAPKDWTYQFAKGFDCDLSTNGVVEPNVVFAQTCSTGPVYRLTIDGGVAGSVLWSLNGGPTATQLGTFSVAPGSTVKIVATPAPGMGFTGAGLAALERTFEKTFTTGEECDLTTLALTGQNVTGYLVIAVILFQVGLALVAVQFVRSRRKARHLAV